MISLTIEEAQLYKMLVAFFGHDRIVPHMTVKAVCGGELPAEVVTAQGEFWPVGVAPQDVNQWAVSNKCLFTVVDEDDLPKLVIDFEGADIKGINVAKLEYQKVARPILNAAGVKFFTISTDEFSEMLNPSGTLDLFSLLKGRCEELGIIVLSPSE